MLEAHSIATYLLGERSALERSLASLDVFKPNAQVIVIYL